MFKFSELTCGTSQKYIHSGSGSSERDPRDMGVIRGENGSLRGSLGLRKGS